MRPKLNGLRNFTVRFREAELQRVESKAKPYFGGRVSTGEAIRRLAEERLDEIEKGKGAETCHDALLRLLGDFRSTRLPSIADLRFLASGATGAYRRCTADFVARDLLIANVRAFRDALWRFPQQASARKSRASRYSLPDENGDAHPIDGKGAPKALDQWIAQLPAWVTRAQAEHASANLAECLRGVDGSHDAQLRSALCPYVGALLQLSIRGYWQVTHRPLLPETDLPAGYRRDLTPIRVGRIAIEGSVGDHAMWLAIELANHSGVLANDLIEIEELHCVTRLALERGDVRGEVFRYATACGGAGGFELSTHRARWMIERSDVIAIAEALDELKRKGSIANLIERGAYVYGRI
ncbi:MAG TPA: hypothetical protein VJ738_19475 [Steroidobacteraceae bacterium]|nr:hypothetical protein [Steroidobacteraceae bacterium]